MADEPAAEIRWGSTTGRWIIVATVLGSGIAFLDGTVVNVALPAISKDLDTDIAGLQWVVDAYLVTLTSILLFGGSLGDRLGRRKVFVAGLVAFTIASVACAAAPNVEVLALARAVQGVGAAFLVPGSLAIIGAAFHEEDRGRAIGAWAGLSGTTTALGPFVGGWLVDNASWRWVFVINVPLAIIAVALTMRHVPESRAAGHQPLDGAGAVLASVGLGAVCWALIESGRQVGAAEIIAGTVGVAALIAFVVVEAKSSHPMLPLSLFRSRQFTGVNLTTLAVYGALGTAFFMIVLELQLALGFSATAAGSALLPITGLMLLLSPRAGALSQRIGPRLPMTIGPVVVAAGLLMFTRIEPGATYAITVLPAALVFGLGLSLTVAPLTSTVLSAVPDDQMGVASGVNNAAARLAGLLSVAVLPAVVNLDTTLPPEVLTDRVAVALQISAVLAALGGLIAFLTVRTQKRVIPGIHADVSHPCFDPRQVQEVA